MSILYTSLAEIKSFNPCVRGWRAILAGRNKTEVDDELFPLKECLLSNSFSDVCWLLGKRKVEIEICVNAAKMCADSVAHAKKSAAAASANANASYATTAAVAHTNAYYAAAAAYYAAATAYYATATAAYATAAYAASYATAAAEAAAAEAQRTKNKQFLLEAIEEFESKN